MTTQPFPTLATILFVGAGWLCSDSPAAAQAPMPALSPAATSAPPTVVHIHHHYYNLGSPQTERASAYAPKYAWNFGYQPATGQFISPWKQNWGRLGFTGYLGQHGGGVDITLQPQNVFTGLVVDTVTPGSPANRMGLVPGDFILKIDGTAVDSYKQVALLFDQAESGNKPEITLTVWNPNTRRTSELKAIIDKN